MDAAFSLTNVEEEEETNADLTLITLVASLQNVVHVTTHCTHIK